MLNGLETANLHPCAVSILSENQFQVTSPSVLSRQWLAQRNQEVVDHVRAESAHAIVL